MRNLRVGVVFDSLSESTGGAFTFVRNTLSAIENYKGALNFEFVFFSSGIAENPYQFDREIHLLPSIKLGVFQSALQKICIRLGIKIEFTQKTGIYRHPWDVIFRSENIDFVWSLAPVRAPFSTPFANTIWDIDHLQQPFFPEFSLGGEWETRERDFQKSIPTASLVICGTDFSKSEIARKYRVSEDRIVVSPFPIPVRRVDQTSRSRYLLFYPAQFWAHKNHINLLRSISILKRNGLGEIRLILTGSDMGTREMVENEVQILGLEEQVEILGFVDAPELQRLYMTASLVVFPSYLGPDNLPPLEALSYSTPIAVSDVPGLREHLGEAVSYFDPDSPESMATVISQLLIAGEPEEMLESKQELKLRLNPDRSVEAVIVAISNLVPRFRNFTSGI